MKFRRMTIAGVVCAACCVGIAARGAVEDLLSGDEVKQLVDAGKYQDALKSLQGILALRGPPAARYDRYEMLMLQGECQLQIRESNVAVLSFTAAREEAFAEKKPERAGPALAMMELVQRSAAYAYKPRAAGGGPAISILDVGKRKEAFAALLIDELPAVKRGVAGLPKVTMMGPVLEAAKAVGIVRAVEMAATNDSVQTDALVTAVSTQATKLMSAALTDFQGHADAIAKHANDLITEPVPQYDQVSGKAWLVQKTHKRGPTADESNSLRDIVATCEKIQAATKAVAMGLGTEFEAMDSLGAKANLVKIEAAGILSADYSVEVKQ